MSVPWFKVDDGLPMSRKVLGIPRRRRMAAIGLWTLAGAWCARELTDGRVPEWLIDELGANKVSVDDLVAVGLWKPELNGWLYHDWHNHQPSKEQVQADRAEHARRQKEYRERKKREREAARQKANESQRDVSRVTQSDVTRDTPGDAAVTGGVTTARPDPTRPDPTVVPTELPRGKNSSSRTSHEYPDDFEEFWAIYPRLEGKNAALRAWRSALKQADAAEIMAGAKRYVDAKRGEQQKFLKTPAAWLNGGHWMDQHGNTEPLTFGGGDRPVWEM